MLCYAMRCYALLTMSAPTETALAEPRRDSRRLDLRRRTDASLAACGTWGSAGWGEGWGEE